jgi:ribosomal protein S18 acetylase RimI-like enzyme
MRIRPFREADEPYVIDLWQSCDLTRPWNDPRKDIARKLTVQRDLFLVCEIDGDIVATVMAGYDGHRGWVNYLAVHPGFRRRSIARQMMAFVEARLLDLGCPKINLQLRSTNQHAVAFYNEIGFAQDDAISFGKRLIPDDSSA